MSCGGQWRDPLGRPKEGSPSCETRGKRTMRSQGVPTYEKSTNGIWSRWLTVGERRWQKILDIGEKWMKMEASAARGAYRCRREVSRRSDMHVGDGGHQ
jgi:hypothetical protein